MSDNVFFDTNILIYSIAKKDPRAETARVLLARGGVLSVQVLNEFVATARRKIQMTWAEIASALSAFRVLCPETLPMTIETHERAMRIAERSGYGIYDSLVIASAAEASCVTLYSEDMRHGQKIEGVTICNPFPDL